MSHVHGRLLAILAVFWAMSLCVAAQDTKSTHRTRVPTARTHRPASPRAREAVARASDIQPPLLNLAKIKNPKVAYVPVFQLKKYPIPAVVFLRDGLSNDEDKQEIQERIIYPVINKSEKPIAAIIVEFYPNRTEIGVTLVWHEAGDGYSVEYVGALLQRNKYGHFDPDAFLRLVANEDE